MKKRNLIGYVESLEGKSKGEKRNFILNEIKKLGYKPKLEKYSRSGFEGMNIIVSIGSGKKEILAVTHYDVVPGSPGANDNASTIAVLFNILKKLKKYKVKNKIVIAIFDDEEVGIVGSSAYVEKHGVKNIVAVYNMELVGMGDMMGIWPVTRDVEKSPVLENLRKSIKDLGYYYEEAGKLSLFSGDYLAFRRAGVKDSFCISVIPKKERKSIRRFVEAPALWSLIKVNIGFKIPNMFQIYHSSEDKSKYLNESALEMTSNVLFKALVNMDRASNF